MRNFKKIALAAAIATATPVFVRADAGTNIDTVESTVSYLLSANIENLILRAGSGALTGTGNALANVLTGNENNNTLIGVDGNDTLNGMSNDDTLNGGNGDDSMVGSTGNDTYVVDSAAEASLIYENANEGTDSIQSDIAWTLGSNFENLTLTGTANRAGTGNELANAMVGNTGANTLDGKAGNDSLTGGSGADTFQFTVAPSATTNKDTVADMVAGTDKIKMNTSVFTSLTAGTLPAGQLRSGAGVTTAADTDDYVLYNTSTGELYYDADGSAATYSPINFATLTTKPAIAATDFTLAAMGGSGSTLTGTSGNDWLTGADLNDSITGGAGNDIVDGMAGKDTLIGGTGDDVILIDRADETVTENAGEGTDSVWIGDMTTAYTIPANVEALACGYGLVRPWDYTANCSITGSTNAETLIGAGGNDTIASGAGTDTVAGGDGNDNITNSGGNDSLSGDGGDDSITGSINNETLNGGYGNDTIAAAQGADVIDPGFGQDSITAGTGNDTIQGSGGADYIDGGSDTDTVVYDLAKSYFTVSTVSGTTTVTSQRNAYVVDTIVNVETLNFAGETCTVGTDC